MPRLKYYISLLKYVWVNYKTQFLMGFLLIILGLTMSD
jgi:hypothetical protein